MSAGEGEAGVRLDQSERSDLTLSCCQRSELSALRDRTQDGLYMSWPNMLPQGGSEVLLFYVDD
jgi:hypothetical protein